MLLVYKWYTDTVRLFVNTDNTTGCLASSSGFVLMLLIYWAKTHRNLYYR